MLRKIKFLFIALAMLPVLLMTTAFGGVLDATYVYSEQGGTPYGIIDNTTDISQIATSQIDVDNLGIITDVTVSVTLSHDWIGDLVIQLLGPDSLLPLVLMERPSAQAGYAGGADVSVVEAAITFSDDVIDPDRAANDWDGSDGELKPAELLSAFDGSSMYGDWTLLVSDEFEGWEGTVIDWSLTIQYEQIPLPSSILLMGLGLLAIRIAKRRS